MVSPHGEPQVSPPCGSPITPPSRRALQKPALSLPFLSPWGNGRGRPAFFFRIEQFLRCDNVFSRTGAQDWHSSWISTILPQGVPGAASGPIPAVFRQIPDDANSRKPVTSRLPGENAHGTTTHSTGPRIRRGTPAAPRLLRRYPKRCPHAPPSPPQRRSVPYDRRMRENLRDLGQKGGEVVEEVSGRGDEWIYPIK